MYVPSQKERLVKVVEDIKNNVVVGGGVDVRAWELAVDENTFLRNS